VNRRIRRTFVISAVVASLLAGAVSIQVAADMTAAAAPPPAPPISMEALRSSLAAEQARGAALQAQLDELLTITDGLTVALTSTESEVSVDGLTAKQLRERLTAADAKLATMDRLFKETQRRLAALGGAGPTFPPIKPANGAGAGGSGSSSGSTSTPAPTARPATFSLSLGLVSGGVLATWTTCSAGGFDSYALVRSTDSEIHYPPEDGDTLVARISNAGTTSTTVAAPSGTRWYRLYCLVVSNGESKTAATTSTMKITVP
jgi:hypothetical protein